MRRYQTIIIPLYDPNVICTKILSYFLLNSALGIKYNGSERNPENVFCYTCIGFAYSALSLPFNKPLLAISPEITSKLKKVFILVFDMESNTQSELITNSLKKIPLGKLLDKNDIISLNKGYLQYGISDKPFNLVEESSLGDLAVVVDYCVDNFDIYNPIKSSWELLNRKLSHFAYSNKEKVVVGNENEQENVCIVFKDISVNEKMTNSISWTIESLFNKGLILTGMRFGFIQFSDLDLFRSKVVDEVFCLFIYNDCRNLTKETFI